MDLRISQEQVFSSIQGIHSLIKVVRDEYDMVKILPRYCQDIAKIQLNSRYISYTLALIAFF